MPFDKMFQVPLSWGELALDRVAFENWLANGGEADVWQPREALASKPNPENERRMARKRRQWMAAARERAELLTSQLQVRILKQRTEREGSPILFKALQLEGKRAAWLKRGMFYHGQPCAKCGGTKRYKSNGDCVACKTHPHISLRLIALAAGAQTYQAMPCKKCGDTTRFAKSRQCVRCVHARYQQQVATTDKAALRAEWAATKRQQLLNPKSRELKRAADRRYHEKKRAAS